MHELETKIYTLLSGMQKSDVFTEVNFKIITSLTTGNDVWGARCGTYMTT